jgi:hypothetical protein
VKALVIGGPRHGEWIEGLPDGIRMWIDVEHAARHVIRKLTQTINEIGTGEITGAFEFYVAVHEQLQSPGEPQVVSQLLNMLAMAEFAKTHGTPLEIPKEPAGSSLIVPGT